MSSESANQSTVDPTSQPVINLQPRKVALIIGNQNYQNMAVLNVTINDAKLVEATLKSLGFLTTIKLDLTNQEMRNELDNFGEEIVQEHDLVFLYYSGHAGQQSKTHVVDNFLFGVDASEDDNGNWRGVSFKNKLQNALYKDCLYVIILDACRVYPDQNTKYVTKSAQDNSDLTIDPQLTLVMPEIPENKECEFVFACHPGRPALEETSKENGFLARALCNGLNQANTWDQVTKIITKQVKEETSGRQIPIVQSSLTQTLYVKSQQPTVESSSSKNNILNNPAPTTTSTSALALVPPFQLQEDYISVEKSRNLVMSIPPKQQVERVFGSMGKKKLIPKRESKQSWFKNLQNMQESFVDWSEYTKLPKRDSDAVVKLEKEGRGGSSKQRTIQFYKKGPKTDQLQK